MLEETLRVTGLCKRLYVSCTMKLKLVVGHGATIYWCVSRSQVLLHGTLREAIAGLKRERERKFCLRQITLLLRETATNGQKSLFFSNDIKQ